MTQLDPSTPTDQSGDRGLQISLTGLAQLGVGSGEAGLAAMLTRVAQLAVDAVPRADGAGLTLLEPERPDIMVATTGFVSDVDAIQYGLGQGPCISAAASGHTVRSGSLSTDAEWPKFGAMVARLDVHSALSVPLRGPTQVVGSINIYAHAADAFDERAAELAELFAVPASVTVGNAQALIQAQRLAAQLQGAMTNRAVIDQAIGMVMSRVGCDAKEAFDRLRQMSQTQNKKLSAVADDMVNQAVRRARARRPTISGTPTERGAADGASDEVER